MKNITFKILIYITLLIISSLPIHVNAQEEHNEPISNLEINNNSSVDVEVNEVSILSIVGLLVVTISVPFVISFFIQILTEHTLSSYICTYCLVVLLYYLVSLFVTDMSGSRNIMTYVFLLLPSMVGSLIAQFTYYMLLVREGKKYMGQNSP